MQLAESFLSFCEVTVIFCSSSCVSLWVSWDVQRGLGLVLSSRGVPLGILATLLEAGILRKCCSHCCENVFFRICVFEMFVSNFEDYSSIGKHVLLTAATTIFSGSLGKDLGGMFGANVRRCRSYCSEKHILKIQLGMS